MNRFAPKWSPDRGPAFLLTGLASLVLLAVVVGLFLFLLIESIPVFQQIGWKFLWGRDWYPGEAFGALPMIYGSLIVTGLAMILVLPWGVGSALFAAEFVSPHIRWWIKSLMELLAGVPGIVYGLLGVTFVTAWVRQGFGLIDGNCLLAAGLLLSVMVLHTVMTLCDDALQSVPGEYRDAALALGLTRWETIWRVVLPQALPGIGGALFLGMGRAMGETIAVMLVIGGLDRIPDPWFQIFDPGQSIPSKLGREAAEALGAALHWNALIALGLVLFLVVMTMNIAGNFLLRRIRT